MTNKNQFIQKIGRNGSGQNPAMLREFAWPCELLRIPHSYRFFEQTGSLPQPGLVLTEVQKQLRGLSMAEAAGCPLTIGAWNMEFLNASKSLYFLDSYKEILLRHHLLAVEEVDKAGLEIIANACGYRHFISTPNSRGQSVGFLLHERLRVIGCIEYGALTGVLGIPDLRPALRLDLEDEVNQIRFSVTVVHLKSMRGGIKMTGVVRFQQMLNLMRCLGVVDHFSLVTGDFNCFLDHAHDTSPLTENGYVLSNRWNQSPTHHFGGRLDGLFYANMPANLRLGSYNIRNFWRNSQIGCALSDHGLLTWKLLPRRL